MRSSRKQKYKGEMQQADLTEAGAVTRTQKFLALCPTLYPFSDLSLDYLSGSVACKVC